MAYAQSVTFGNDGNSNPNSFGQPATGVEIFLETQGIKGPCDPNVYNQLVDVAQLTAEMEKLAIDKAVDPSDDQSILTLSCFEQDFEKMYKDAKEAWKTVKGLSFNQIMATVADKALNSLQQELQRQAGRFACENIRNFIKNQLEQCFNFRIFERQALGRFGARQQCIISANASVAITRHGFLYTGVEAQGNVSGPGGLQAGVLLGVDAVEGLQNLYSNWNSSQLPAYQSQTAQLGLGCDPLDPTIVSQYSQDYYQTLPSDEMAENVVFEGGQYIYPNVGTYTATNIDGTTESRPYENKATCYGFIEPEIYVPCGYEDDGVTPADCVTIDEEGEITCCDLSQSDCQDVGLPACPCTQGLLNAFVDGACTVGSTSCCNGDLNDCTLPEYAGFPYCEGTDPAEDEVDCDELQDELASQLLYSDDEILANCDESIIEAEILDMQAYCDAQSFGTCTEDPSPCAGTGGAFASVCVFNIDDPDAQRQIVEACQRAITNQQIIDNFDLGGCAVDLDNVTINSSSSTSTSLNGGSTANRSGGSSNSVGQFSIPESNSGGRRSRNQQPVAVPTPVQPSVAPTRRQQQSAQPSTVPSAGSGSNSGNGGNNGGSTSSGGGGLLQRLF